MSNYKTCRVVRLGGRRMLLSGRLDSGMYSIGFTPSPNPLLTEEAVKAFEADPVVILEFDDLASMQVLKSMVDAMIADKTRPQWEVVRMAAAPKDEEC